MSAPVPASDVTRLLQAAHSGDAAAFEALLPLVYEELRGLARSVMRSECAGVTLEPTALVHEAWMRLGAQDTLGCDHRRTFFAAAASTMRRVLVDRARHRAREKHGGTVAHEALDDTIAALEERCGDVLALEVALEELAARDARKARLVELRFYAGLGMRESAEVLELSERQAEREWTVARSFLRERLAAV
ncbi:MAG: sigma-70 family RNA polymerase sigma factor, partial [Planctomycetes bacterium]|nr:sigma-70 family RNA polymerase sigma factor [Planctomycetota bacterium]